MKNIHVFVEYYRWIDLAVVSLSCNKDDAITAKRNSGAYKTAKENNIKKKIKYNIITIRLFNIIYYFSS